MKIEVFKGVDKLWYARVRADNGKIVLASEGHHNEADVIETMKVTKRTIGNAPIVKAAR